MIFHFNINPSFIKYNLKNVNQSFLKIIKFNRFNWLADNYELVIIYLTLNDQWKNPTY